MTNLPFKLEEGGWTPALKTMAVSLVDKILSHPTAALLVDANGEFNPLLEVKERLLRKRYPTFSAWEEEMNSIFTSTKANNDPLIAGVGEDLEKKYLKNTDFLEKVSLFKFRTLANEVVREMETACYILEQNKEDIPLEDDVELVNLMNDLKQRKDPERPNQIQAETQPNQEHDQNQQPIQEHTEETHPDGDETERAADETPTNDPGESDTTTNADHESSEAPPSEDEV